MKESFISAFISSIIKINKKYINQSGNARPMAYPAAVATVPNIAV
jgi:hypothetical protein